MTVCVRVTETSPTVSAVFIARFTVRTESPASAAIRSSDGNAVRSFDAYVASATYTSFTEAGQGGVAEDVRLHHAEAVTAG